MVANHAIVVLAPKVPNGQVAVGLVVQHHIADKLCSNVGGNEGIKRMGSAEGIPKAESAVVNLSFRHLLDFEVGGHITAIHIAHRVGLHQHMIETRVKNGLLFIRTFNIDAAEFTLPSVMGGFHIVIETPTLAGSKLNAALNVRPLTTSLLPTLRLPFISKCWLKGFENSARKYTLRILAQPVITR